MWEQFAAWVEGVPAPIVYLCLGVGAALENVIPVIPADTFVVLGGFLSAVGQLDARWVFLATWLCNVASALGMYRLGHRYGHRLLQGRWGRRFLSARQMERMETFYQRWGVTALFLTRFLPGVRSVVPIFAGVSHQPFFRVAIPLAAASVLWYGALVWLGALAGDNLGVALEALRRVNVWLLVAATVVIAGAVAAWWRTRHDV